MQGKVIDECLQLFGGYGFIWEYPVARAYPGARVARIYAGASEVMKLIISRALFSEFYKKQMGRRGGLRLKRNNSEHLSIIS